VVVNLARLWLDSALMLCDSSSHRKRPAQRLVGWSARSRAAARTNELEADERRRIIESGEGPFMLAFEGCVVVPGRWLAEWSRKHPFGVWPV